MPKQFAAGASKPAALLLCPEAPYPMTGGGPLRSASVLEYLAARYATDVIVFREPGAVDPRSLFPPGLIRSIDVIELPYHSRDKFARTARNLKRFLRGAPPLVDRFARFDQPVSQVLAGRKYALAVIEHFWCARYVSALRECSDKVILDLHNIESVLLTRSARAEHWAGAAALSRFAHACRKMERRWLREFDLLLVASEEDQNQTSELAPAVRSVVYPNTIPFTPLPDLPKAHAIVFSGNLEYHPNAGAIRFFFDHIWPTVRVRWPHLEWHLVGKNDRAVPERVRADPRVRVIGAVENAIRSIACCQCAVVPLLAGSGTRFKIVEAWAAGVPVVSTTVGAEGLPGTPGEHIVIADDPADFARAISSVLDFPEFAAALGRNGRALYEAELTWPSAWKKLEEAGV